MLDSYGAELLLVMVERELADVMAFGCRLN